jgi:hypothetical protein
MDGLVASWRALAKHAECMCTEDALKMCAGELEKAIHGQFHDAAWDFGCTLCIQEMEEEVK